MSHSVASAQEHRNSVILRNEWILAIDAAAFLGGESEREIPFPMVTEQTAVGDSAAWSRNVVARSPGSRSSEFWNGVEGLAKSLGIRPISPLEGRDIFEQRNRRGASCPFGKLRG
jgi:hypothetical protein